MSPGRQWIQRNTNHIKSVKQCSPFDLSCGLLIYSMVLTILSQPNTAHNQTGYLGCFYQNDKSFSHRCSTKPF